MARFVTPETTEKIKVLMFGESTGDSRERFLEHELMRYIPQLVGRTDEEIVQFVDYQKEIYLQGKLPKMGQPIASLNPTFTDSTEAISFSSSGGRIYTRASVKENGYRMQIHLGDTKVAFTRQFTRYDLRMFPELSETFQQLPVMIGDGELANKRHIHLAGFNRVQLRIPDQTYWPKPGQAGLEEKALAKYLSNPNLFVDGGSLPDTELTFVFHGLFAIADPKTWDRPREVQMKNLVSLCKLPVDYYRIDDILNKLAEFIQEKSLNARVVERVVVTNHQTLKTYVEKNEEQGFEGTCVVQSLWDEQGKIIVAPRSVKIKAYETLDCILLGLYLEKTEIGLVEENIRGALLGLYDDAHGVYFAVTKVNLDPSGVQIKTAGQKQRLTILRAELIKLVTGRVDLKQKVLSLQDVFLLEGKKVVEYIFGKNERNLPFEDVINNLPLRSDLAGLCEVFKVEQKEFCEGTAKLNTVPRKFIADHLAFFEAVEGLDKKGQKRFFGYFSRAKQIKATSAKLVKPQVVVNTGKPIILETQVFDIKWASSPYPAGFHSWFGNSFYFNNCFAERVRHDKSTTTDYAAVHALARMFTPK
jgi:hypothetical protein